MFELNAASKKINMPERLKARPIDNRGWVVPWFVHTVDATEGSYDFRVIGRDKVRDAVVGNLCWICGQRLGRYKTFAVGPMCTVNSISSEPPSHKSCAVYAAQICPFLTQPKMVRNDKGLDQIETEKPGGVMIMRNPGVSILWTTTTFTITPERLFHMGKPTEIEGWARGKRCTTDDILEGIGSGIHLLIEQCEQERTPERKALARLELDSYTAYAIRLVGGDPEKVAWFKPVHAGHSHEASAGERP